METTESGIPQKFGFLVHAREVEDIFRKFPALKIIPRGLLKIGMKYAPPIIASKITGLTTKESKPLDGYIFAITMTAKQMVEDREFALKKINQAINYAQKKGVGIIGLGALTASFSKGGLAINSKGKPIGITTGRAYTTKTVTDYVKQCIVEFGFNKSKVQIAIVGAGGSIGSSCAKILAYYGIKNFLFIDLPKRAEHLKQTIENIKMDQAEINIFISHSIHDIKNADIIITATNAPEVLVVSEDLTPGTIIINDAQPSDVSIDVLKNRQDVLVIEGGVIHTPGIKGHLNMGLADEEDTFCCLGEVLILAHNQHFEDFALGELDIKLINRIENMSEELSINLAKFQNSLGYISEEQIAYVKNIISHKSND